jgi:hypothetical protein
VLGSTDFTRFEVSSKEGLKTAFIDIDERRRGEGKQWVSSPGRRGKEIEQEHHQGSVAAGEGGRRR